MTKKITLLILISNAFVCISQNDSIAPNKLKEVIVVGNKKAEKLTLGTKSMDLSTEELVKNPTNFTSLLRYTSPIVFRDYGYGGVSTARFRGTSATNTLVLWNGVPINAVGSGQTDFNSLSANISDKITITSGGGSVEFGSGAIGGTIDLVDNLSYKKHQDFHLFSSYGSFETSSNFFTIHAGDGNWAVKLASTYNTSENNYTYIDENYRDSDGSLFTNLNGNYENYGITFALGYQFSKTNKVSFYTTGYFGDRLFSAGLPNPYSGSERNIDLNQRNLLKWNIDFGNFKQLINASYTTQQFNYYSNKDADNFDYGKSKNYRLSYDLKYLVSEKITFKGIVEANLTDGESSTMVNTTEVITERERKALAFIGGVHYKPIKGLTTALELRNEFNSDFEVPIAFSFSNEYKLNNYITFKGLMSSNYRVPTFNEMYWPVVGDENLLPETALQGELGALLSYKDLNVQVSTYYIHTDNKIIWRPTGGSNLWSPSNINSAMNKGAELYVSYSKSFGKDIIKSAINYMYTIAKDLERNSFLPYVPIHATNINIEYQRDWFKFYVQTLYQGNVYTNLVNIDRYTLDAVFVNNIGIDINVFEKDKKQIIIGGKINNIANELYYFSNLRPMPERNFNININYKF